MSQPAIAVLCSGQGTNLQAIINALRARRLRARLAVVIADRRNAVALVRAKRAGLATAFVNPRDFSTREGFDRRLIEILDQHRAQLVCLAGFMRILSPRFVRHFRSRILNIHPALLPVFPGAHAIRDALAWGAKVTGVTVHLVDEQVDHGPILLQEAVAIRPADTQAMLLARVHQVEHRLYVKAIALMLSGRVRVRGRRVIVTSSN
ncbi:MAG TPA: phosphoribosylglycinamide formyltransferase [Candidatus Omnitrophica bacterium]|nr:MAG: phosphoribosylglycinamide formyltransferase [Omnitrophica WOR_2 bacterium GWA2_63_20]OGX17931.1 MAG: phosphoribosylglycinamide formyltransferase [Omnitrophica WOR_2 bacterium GWF2_63_9]OGX32643.1 MAG: phosphoribosylglycinamide formyltransferase [Omnitrophica WOR_2 bacterium RIFCSPHIGHO2_12_FULL_64_13]OGX44457.1 MAG: phosphoribosylglycinamide formyltransferase [Omnitrophica WOR_2 bacterium RIFCSPLOWO2_02_FULL_63_16]OGX50061.1 MAG: phosphoribosylglycinamide formyltransferase [Omnitrophica